jgi:hypothetical protein
MTLLPIFEKWPATRYKIQVVIAPARMITEAGNVMFPVSAVPLLRLYRAG